MDIEQIAVYKADEEYEELIPKLATSNDEDVHNLFIISHKGHSAAADIICSPTVNVYLPDRKHQTIPYTFVPCCELHKEWRSTYIGYINKVIHASFKPGDWVTGGCYEFPPVDAQNATCVEKTREVILSLSQRAAVQIKKARRKGKKSLPGTGGGPSTRDKDAEDQEIARGILAKLVQGIKEVAIKGANPSTTDELRTKLADYRKGQGDNGSELENLLWDDSVNKEDEGKQAGWERKHMFASSRYGRRTRGMKILGEADVSIQEKKKRWEESGAFLNGVVNDSGSQMACG